MAKTAPTFEECSDAIVAQGSAPLERRRELCKAQIERDKPTEARLQFRSKQMRECFAKEG
jgi:hypothetical protein